ncbi:hypothetical protein KAJ38_03040 [Candidatus Pacearchaeota archaeon]|nr:hypothetical protein [Candidatus Pacearchaeota archaeon]
MNEKVTRIVSKISSGHNGRFGCIYVEDNITLTFSLESPVWNGEGSTSLKPGDWVTVEGIRIHGNPPRKRAGHARLATEEESNREWRISQASRATTRITQAEQRR